MFKYALVGLLCASMLFSCANPGNVDHVKAHAEETFAAQNYKITGYQGYQWGSGLPFTTYGGACVWYQLEKVPDNGIIYEACLKRWGDEVHVYNTQAVDAIRPRN